MRIGCGSSHFCYRFESGEDILFPTITQINQEKMAFEQANVSLTGDLIDDLAMVFRELVTKVGFH